VWEQFVFYNSRIVEKMKTIDFILDGKFHLHTPKKEGFRTKSKVALKKKGALFGHSSSRHTDGSVSEKESLLNPGNRIS
jgi:hypothetical protein